jgi:hypothetical protein
MEIKELAGLIGTVKATFHTNAFSQRVQTGWSVQFSEDSLKEFSSKFGDFPDFIELRGVAIKHGTKESQIYRTPYGTTASNFYVRMDENQLNSFVDELKGGIVSEPEFVALEEVPVEVVEIVEEVPVESAVELVIEPILVDGDIDEETLPLKSTNKFKKSIH